MIRERASVRLVETLVRLFTADWSRFWPAPSVARVVETEEALDSITHAVERIHQMAEQMAAAAEQQNLVAEDVSRQISNISTAAEENAEVTARSAHLGGELEATAHALHALVARFDT